MTDEALIDSAAMEAQLVNAIALLEEQIILSTLDRCKLHSFQENLRELHAHLGTLSTSTDRPAVDPRSFLPTSTLVN